MPDYGRAHRGAASSPILAPRQMLPLPPVQDPSVRSMRLKVLYTFDDESKTNCLARWPQSIDIRTAFLDESTQIGIIELKTCIQAIVAASPELVAKLGQDYTVYAYDYSEYETPLVGQGMLSWVLASSSSTPAAPAHQSRTMVTGRVCKNGLGLFSSNPQETLEVKLRLVPVPTSLQSEYIESMKKYRDVSQMMPAGFDPQAWTAFVKANPGFLQQATQSRSQSPAVTQQGFSGFQQVHHLLNGDESQAKPNEVRRPLSRAQSCIDINAGSQLPRMPSPALSVQSSVSAPKRRGRKPGPKGPRGGRAATRKQDPPPVSNDAGYCSNDERQEEGPAKKRAKVVQTEWSGRQDYGLQADSLRVAASTAASVRIHQPTALRLGAGQANSLEGPPREPTPVGDPFGQRMTKRLQPMAQSSLRRESSASEKRVFALPFEPSRGMPKAAESAVTSPEENSRVDSSPPEMGSSPPVFGGSTAPSSPNLPPLPDHFQDSGFMSGSIDDLFEDGENRVIDEDICDTIVQNVQQPNLSPPQLNRSEPCAEDTSLAAANNTSEQGMSASTQHLRSHDSRARMLNRTISTGRLPATQFPASDPIRPPSLNRSHTWAGEQEAHPASDAIAGPSASDQIERPISRNRKGSDSGQGSGVKRKQAIQSKLATTIAAGEMPPFCDNCGAIETPTWRKAWVKMHSGTPEHVRISDEDGGIVAWQTLQTDHTGTICLYRIIKRSLLKTDEGFSEILLCNPCGLWLHTRKCMRPKEAWDKSQKGPDEKKKRGPAARRVRNGSMSGLGGTRGMGSSSMYSEPSSPTTTGGQTDKLEGEPPLAPRRKTRASSEERTPQKGRHMAMDEASAAAALERAIKSSPHKFIGTQQVPIEVGDLTPQPTRRILFPSPSNSKEGKVKNDAESKISSSPSVEKAHGVLGKENFPPLVDKDAFDEFLVKESELAAAVVIARSTTPTPSKTSKIILKTPQGSPQRRMPPTTGEFFSSAAKALFRQSITMSPTKRSPIRLGQAGLEHSSPFTARMNHLLSESNGHTRRMPDEEGTSIISKISARHETSEAINDPNNAAAAATSPAGSAHTLDFPSLPSLHNTPSGRTARMLDFDFSAFDSQDLISTDVVMPSSPPVWFGGGYGDDDGNGDEEMGESLWGTEGIEGIDVDVVDVDDIHNHDMSDSHGDGHGAAESVAARRNSSSLQS